jgi:putative PEP-CTERM system TPR-repeat lipoprotein
MTAKSLISALFALMIVTAASNNAFASTAKERSYEFYESAISLFNKRDFRAALIQLKNALQQDPRNLSARVLLGKTLLSLGDGVGAERQLWSARNAGADEALIIVPLGRALMLQRKYKLLLDEVRAGNRVKPVEAEVRFLRGQAHLERRELARAEKDFQTAIALSGEHGKALLGLARLRHLEGENKEAEKFVDRALKVAPDNPDASYSKAEILRVRRDFAGALKHYSRTIEINDSHVPARISRAATFIDSNRHNDALADVLYIRRVLPQNPQGIYLHAMILTLNGKYAEANEALRDVANVLDNADPNEVVNDSRAMLLRGVIAYSRRRFDDAYPYLSRFVELVPHHAGARKMLGAILLRRDEALAAVKMLEPAVRIAPDDANLLALLGNAHMRNKDYEKATDAFQKAVEIAPDLKSIKTQLALSQLAIGDNVSATAELETVVAGNQSIGQAEIILGMAKLKDGDHRATLEIAERLSKKEPLNPFPSNLAGLAYLQAGMNAKARESFERALQLQPGYGPPQFNLASIDIAEGKVGQAKQRYESLLEQRPNETRAMMGLASIAEKAGELKSAINWLDQVKKIDETNIGAQLRLIALYQRIARDRDALQLAMELEERNPKNLDVLEAKAATEVATGQTTKAIATLRLAAYTAKQFPNRLMGIANRQLKLRDFEGAQSTLKTLISQDPDFLPAHIALVNLEAQSGGVENALDMAEALRTAYPNIPIGDMLAGDMLTKLKRYDEAEAAYRKGLSKGNGAGFAIRLFQLRKHQGKADLALQELKEWDNANPGRPGVQRVLATAYMNAGQTDKAISVHEAFAQAQPNDPAILNNLAILYLKKNDPRALATAERALKLAPGSPALLDTYGWILVQKGEASRGLRHLRDAQTRASNRPEIRYHIAVALNKLGRFAEAQREIKDLLGSKQEFADKRAAQLLLQKLQTK